MVKNSCVSGIIVFIAWILILHVEGEEKYFDPHCKWFDNVMICDGGVLPKEIPDGISALVLNDFDIDNKSLKNDSIYGGITHLDIYASVGEQIIADYFDSFENLEYLGVHGEKLTKIDSSAFAGLDGVITLNLSLNPYLGVSFISDAINAEYRTVLPKLESLSIANISTKYAHPVDLNSYFYRSVTIGRKIRTLDISGLNVFRFDYLEYYTYACSCIETFVAKNAVLSYAVNFLSTPSCLSLKSLDISGANIPVTRYAFSFEYFDFFCFGLRFYFETENFYLENINIGTYLILQSYVLQMKECPMKMKRIKISGNKIKWVNITVNLHEITKQSLEELDLSFNEIEYMSPDVLKPSVNLKILDFSHNKLGIMEQGNQRDFEKLFSAQYKLEVLNISHNGLVNIPKYTLMNNTALRYLDISFNLIESLSFDVEHLIHLEELNAVNNRLKTVSSYFRSQTNFLSVVVMNIRSIKLQENSFQCTCKTESRANIEWMSSEKFINKSIPVYCDLDGKQTDMLTTAAEDTNQHCRLQEFKRVAAFVAPAVALILILIIVLFVLLIRKRRREKAFKSVVSLFEKGAFPLKFVAFLSFSSDDMELVMTRIYPKLLTGLSEMVHSQKQHICLGDKHFRPGLSLRCELIRCISESSVFIAVISGKFCQKPWCNEEFKEAYDQNKPIILIMLDHVDKKLMHPFIKKIFNKNAHASWISDEDGGHLEPKWSLFCKSVLELAGENVQAIQTTEPEQFVETSLNMI